MRYKAQKERNDSILEQVHSQSSQSVLQLSKEHEEQIRELEKSIAET